MSTAKLYTHKIKCQTSFVHLYLNCRILFTLTLYEQNHTYYLLYNIDKRINNYNNNTRQETSTFTIVRDRTHPLLLAFLVFWSAEREIFSKTYGSKKFILTVQIIFPCESFNKNWMLEGCYSIFLAVSHLLIFRHYVFDGARCEPLFFSLRHRDVRHFFHLTFSRHRGTF